MPDITFRVAEWSDKLVLRQLLELYQYDMTDFWPQDLNAHGEFGFVGVERYLRNPRLRAYLFLVDGKYAGFGLVDPDVSLPANEFWMGQFFVMKKYRRLGVGRQAARFVFDKVPVGVLGDCAQPKRPSRLVEWHLSDLPPPSKLVKYETRGLADPHQVGGSSS